MQEITDEQTVRWADLILEIVRDAKRNGKEIDIAAIMNAASEKVLNE